MSRSEWVTARFKSLSDTYGHLIPGADVKWIDRLTRRRQLNNYPQPRRNQSLSARPSTYRKLLNGLVGPEGFEPPTKGL